MFAFVLLSLAASAAAGRLVFVYEPCPEVKPVVNFNLTAWATGKWYEVARYPNVIEYDGDCGWAEYVLTGDGFSIKNYDVAKGKLRTVEGSAQVAEDAGNTGKLSYSYPYGDDGAFTNYTLWVLGTDYDNYAVVYYCKYNAEHESRQDFVWVFSRSKKLEGGAEAAVDKIIRDNAFLNARKMIKPNFSYWSCRVDPF